MPENGLNCDDSRSEKGKIVRFCCLCALIAVLIFPRFFCVMPGGRWSCRVGAIVASRDFMGFVLK